MNQNESRIFSKRELLLHDITAYPFITILKAAFIKVRIVIGSLAFYFRIIE